MYMCVCVCVMYTVTCLCIHRCTHTEARAGGRRREREDSERKRPVGDLEGNMAAMLVLVKLEVRIQCSSSWLQSGTPWHAASGRRSQLTLQVDCYPLLVLGGQQLPNQLPDQVAIDHS